MAVKLSERAYDHARRLIEAGQFVPDDRDRWSEDEPSPDAENAFIEAHGYDEYALWHLGVDDERPSDRKGHYKFPYGDFSRVHRCGVLAAESRAGQRRYTDIQSSAAHLHGMIEAAAALDERSTTRQR
jgi:hypothetical protein